MWGYDSNPWIQRAVRSGVTVHRVKVPAERIEVPNEEDKLWRYMDFVKLLALLQRRSLYFCRVDKLGDQFEGRWSDRTIGMLRTRENLWISEETHQILIEDRRTGDRLELPKTDIGQTVEETILGWQSHVTHPGNALQRTYANCWHGGEGESEAMWKLYAGEKYGIAIRTTARKLLASFTEFLPDYFGEVKYVSYDTHAIPIATLPPVFCKRSAFSHEREIRAVVAPFQREPEDADQDYTELGIKCPVSPDQLIEEIVVSPYSPAWLHDVIRCLLRDLNLDIELKESVMAREPLGNQPYLSVNNLRVFFACFLGERPATPSCLRIWATCRRDALIVAREYWGLPELDTSSLEVFTKEEYLEDYGCLPEHFEKIPNRFNTPFQDSLDPDISSSTC